MRERRKRPRRRHRGRRENVLFRRRSENDPWRRRRCVDLRAGNPSASARGAREHCPYLSARDRKCARIGCRRGLRARHGVRFRRGRKVVALPDGVYRRRPHAGWLIELFPAAPDRPSPCAGTDAAQPQTFRRRGARMGPDQRSRRRRCAGGAYRQVRDGTGRGPTGAFGDAKRLLRTSLENNLESQMAREAETLCRALAGDEAARGFAAFAEKRVPKFR